MSYTLSPDMEILDPTNFTRQDPISGSALIAPLVKNHNMAVCAAGSSLWRSALPVLVVDGAGTDGPSEPVVVSVPDVPSLRAIALAAYPDGTGNASLRLVLINTDGDVVKSTTASVAPGGSEAAPTVVTVDVDLSDRDPADRLLIAYWLVTCDASFSLLAVDLAPFPAETDQGYREAAAVNLLDSAIHVTDVRAVDVFSVDALLSAPVAVEADRRGHYWQQVSAPLAPLLVKSGATTTLFRGQIRSMGNPLALMWRAWRGGISAGNLVVSIRLGDGQSDFVSAALLASRPASPEDGWQGIDLAAPAPGIWDVEIEIYPGASTTLGSLCLLEVDP